MSTRTTAEIVADLRASISEPRLGRDRTSHEKVCNEAADRLTELDATLPDCPTCGGRKVYRPPSSDVDHINPVVTCPDCVDGKVSVAQLAATWRAVWAANLNHQKWDHRHVFEYLRAVRP